MTQSRDTEVGQAKCTYARSQACLSLYKPNPLFGKRDLKSLKFPLQLSPYFKAMCKVNTAQPGLS